MKRSELVKFLIIRTIGNFLVLFMIFGFLATFGPAVYYELNYRIEKWQGVRYAIASGKRVVRVEGLPAGKAGLPILRPSQDKQRFVTGGLAPSYARGNSRQDPPLASLFVHSKEKILIPKSTDFSIVIPKIGISQNIFANTDPANPDEFLKILQKGVAHAKGTAFPGMDGTIYLFAHSTDNFWNVGRYNAAFYLIKELEKNDEIVIYFEEKRYDYQVTDKKITEAQDVSYLAPNLGKGELLILQTCWPPGTTWKRLLIFAIPKI